MKKLICKIINPIRLIESESIDFNVGFWKSLGVIFMYTILSLLFNLIFIVLIDKEFLLNNLYIKALIELLLIPLLSVILVYTFGKNNNTKNIYCKINKDTIIYLALSIILFRLLYSISISPLLNLIPTNEILEETSISLFNSIPYLIITACICAPIIEEIILRGIILGGFLKKFNPTFSIFLSALLFSLLHGNIHQSVNAFLLGLFLGYVYFRTKSLYLAIFCHFVNNAFVLIISIPISYISPFTNIIISVILSVPLIILIKKNLILTYIPDFISTLPLEESIPAPLDLINLDEFKK